MTKKLDFSISREDFYSTTVKLGGNIMTMPGLSKEPAYLKMKISKSGKISGLY